MAWKGDKPGDNRGFNDLLQPLSNSNIKRTNFPLYQVISQFIQRATLGEININSSIKEIVGQITEIGDIVLIIQGNIDSIEQLGILLAEPVPIDPTTNNLVLPNARELLAGIGITFDDSIPNQRTINAVAGVGTSYVPLATGAEPLEIMSNGAGSVLLVAFNP